MKIVLINTDDTTGGAAIACSRLYEALSKENVSVKMLVQEKKGHQKGIESFANTWFQKKQAFLRFLGERLYFLPYEKSKTVRFAFSPAVAGVDISQHPLVQEADILHLHWINFGFLSLASIQKLIATGKPIVWTLHDMWVFTGGCHHSGACENYQNNCGNCINFLKNPSDNDLSEKIWHRKSTIFGNPNLSIVTCSQWLQKRAEKSSLLKNTSVQAIPNPLDIDLFQPISKIQAKDKLGFSINKKYILFAAAKISVLWKGFSYFIKALEILKSQLIDNQEVELIILGQAEVDLLEKLPFKTHALGRISEMKKIVEIYNAADVFVIPSLEENLPNTIMEAMACATPVVGFETGGIPEMLVHQETGYLAKYKSAEDLAKGIFWTLFEADTQKLQENTRQKVINEYSESIVAKQYLALYQQILDLPS